MWLFEVRLADNLMHFRTKSQSHARVEAPNGLFCCWKYIRLRWKVPVLKYTEMYLCPCAGGGSDVRFASLTQVVAKSDIDECNPKLTDVVSFSDYDERDAQEFPKD